MLSAVVILLLSWSPPPALAAEPDALREAQTSFQSVVVKPGDTLWGISHTWLKDPARWDEILKYNKLPTQDPTVALPGLTLKVPIKLIKTSLRAAHVVYLVNKVLYRRKETADWKGAKMEAEVYQGDSLRTLEESKARVMFLSKEILNLEQNSMAVIKPSDSDADVELKAGSVFTGHARIVTATARITPRTGDTRYSATVEPNMTTRVEVFKGAAAVSAQGASVVVPAGMQTRVAPGLAPEMPKALENAADLEARAQEFMSAATVGGGAAPDPKVPPPQPEPEADAEAAMGSDIQVLKIGEPILGYHVQASVERDFRRPVFDKRYGTDDRFAAEEAGLKPGAYWWRVSAVDLLGTEGRFHDPRYYTVGIKRADPENERLASMVSLVSPEQNAEVSDTVRVSGFLRDERLKLEINGRPVNVASDGSFAVIMKTVVGGNSIVITVSDGKGNTATISRHVIHM